MLGHGGVAWAPYRDRFAALLEGSRAETREVYPASEGFFAIADGADGEGLRLQLDTGIFYEFVPLDQLDSANPDCRWIGDVEPGVNYALAVSTCAGLWRYLVGDTVRVVERTPPRVLVTGRTSYMLSAFGEHVIGAEIDRAVAEAARAIGATVSDFAAGSVFAGRDRRTRRAPLHRRAGGGGRRGRHRTPRGRRASPRPSTRRSAASTTTTPPTAPAATAWTPRACAFSATGAFAAWMKSRGKLGGQNKVPRVINDRALFAALQRFADGYDRSGR